MTPEGTISARLGSFAEGLRYEDLPSSLVDHAKLCMTDALGVAFASSTLEHTERAIGATLLLGDGHHPVIGRTERFSLRDAMLINGVLIHGIDFDDTHMAGVVHASASALPAALCLSAAQHLSGREFLTGYILGLEVATRLGVAARGGFHDRGFHPTGVVGAFSAATLCARLRGLPADAIATAQGFAGSLASGTQEFLSSGAWTKRVHGGWAAVSGLVASAFAAQGFVSPPEVYEGRYGLFEICTRDSSRADLDGITRDLGAEWEAFGVAVKLYPACHFTHAFVDAVQELRSAGLDPEEVEAVECLVPEQVIPVVCEPAPAKALPRTDYEARFSLPYVVAAALRHGRVGLTEFEPAALADAEVRSLAKRVRYRADPASRYPRSFSGEIVVSTRDGRTLRHREDINRGAPGRPVSRDAVLRKFTENMAYAGQSTLAGPLAEGIGSIEQAEDMHEVAELLRGDAMVVS